MDWFQQKNRTTAGWRKDEDGPAFQSRLLHRRAAPSQVNVRTSSMKSTESHAGFRGQHPCRDGCGGDTTDCRPDGSSLEITFHTRTMQKDPGKTKEGIRTTSD